MSNKTLYFGTRERMAWVACPAIDSDISTVKWSTQSNFLNGGAALRSSSTGHKEYQFSWNLASAEDIYSVLDYAAGLYGTGPFYFLDPFAENTNVLPSFWASPRVQSEDGPPFTVGVRPTLVATGVNTLGYPTQSAVYTFLATSAFASLWIPIPPGYTFHFGAHGFSTGTAAITLQPDGFSSSTATLLDVIDTTRTNETVTGVSGVTISFSGVGLLTLSGLMAQVRPNSESVPPGGFISGRGHSGCAFSGAPKLRGYSSALDKQAASATFVEVGAWQ